MAFGDFFHSDLKTAALIDIGSVSVGGALAVFPEKENPIICYTTREEITFRGDSPTLADMESALTRLVTRLQTDGVPALARLAGSGHVREILISLAAPWQTTRVEVRTVEKKTPFTFSHSIITEAFAAEESTEDTKRILGDHAVIATLLNGYDTNEPFGKHAKRADLVILTTTLDEDAALAIKGALLRTFHRKEMRLCGFSFIAYTVFRDVYAHEKEYLILDVTGEVTDISLVKRGVLVDVAQSPCGLNGMIRAAGKVPIPERATGALEGATTLMPTDIYNPRFAGKLAAAKEAWRTAFQQTLESLSKRFPLPRTVFLLSDDEVRDFLQKIIIETPLAELRLSDEPFAVLPVSPDQFASYIQTRGEAVGDTFLAMLALFENKPIHRE